MTIKEKSVERVFFWGLLLALLVSFFWMLKPFYSAILFALVLTLVCEPIYEALLKVFRKWRRLSAVLSLLVVLLFLLVPAGILVSLIVDQILEVARRVGPEIGGISLENLFHTEELRSSIERWKEALGVQIDIVQWLKEAAQKSAEYLYQYSPKVVTKTAGFFLTTLIVFILSYFLLVDGPKLYRLILDLSPLREEDEVVLTGEIRTTLRACLYGQLATALVQGLLAGAGFWVAGLPAFLLLGFATFMMAFVPFLGAASVWVLCVLYFLATGAYLKGTLLGLYGFFIISGIDNILKPVLIQGKTQIHPVILFLTIFGGLQLWGPVGILVGPTLVAVLLAVLKIYKRDFRGGPA